MANGVGVYPKVFEHSKQLSLNKFFDPSTPSMRKGCNGENKNETYNRSARVQVRTIWDYLGVFETIRYQLGLYGTI